MKTIDDLVSEHRPIQKMEGLPVYLLKWAVLSLLVLGVSYAILPLNPELPTLSSESIFHLETTLWFLLSLFSGIALYFNSFPDNRLEYFGHASIFIFSMLFALTFYHNDFKITLLEATGELSFFKGRCGFIITFLATIHSAALVWWAKKGAPASPNFSAFWAAVSASSLGCLLMQVVCLHDNSLHLLIWHFFPLSMMCFVIQKYVGRKLHW